MNYRIVPLNDNIVVVALKAQEVKEYTQKTLTDVDNAKLDKLDYGRVISADYDAFRPGDVVLFQKLAAHKTNFGSPRQLLVPLEYVEAKLEKEA